MDYAINKIDVFINVNYSVTELPEHLKSGGIPSFSGCVHNTNAACLSAMQLLLLFLDFLVRLLQLHPCSPPHRKADIPGPLRYLLINAVALNSYSKTAFAVSTECPALLSISTSFPENMLPAKSRTSFPGRFSMQTAVPFPINVLFR